MVRVEVGSLGVDFSFVTQIDDRLPKPYGVTPLPIGPSIVVGQFDQNERRVTDLGARDVVDYASLCDAAQVDQVVPKLCVHSGPCDFIDESFSSSGSSNFMAMKP